MSTSHFCKTHCVCSSCGKLYYSAEPTLTHYRSKHGGGASIFYININNHEELENYIKYYGIKHLPKEFQK